MNTAAAFRYPGASSLRAWSPPRLAGLTTDRTSESTRLAYFDQSARTKGGKVPEFTATTLPEGPKA